MQRKIPVYDGKGNRIWGHLVTLQEKIATHPNGMPIIYRSGKEKMIPAGAPIYDKQGEPVMGWLEELEEEGLAGAAGRGSPSRLINL